MTSAPLRLISTVLLALSFWVWSIKPLMAMAPIQRLSLPNQMVVLLSEEHSLPFVTIQMVIDAGSRQDPRGREGLAFLTAKGLLLGTSKQDVITLNEALDFIGASLNVSANKDYASINLRLLKKDLGKGLDLLADTVRQPVFPEDELRKEMNKILGAIKSSEEDPGELAERAFYKAVFPNSPYSYPEEGTRESVPKLTREDVVRFYRSFYLPNNAILSITGDITPEEVKARILPHFLKWPEGQIPKSSVGKESPRNGEMIRINRDLAQANIIIGGIGVERSNPDYYALTVMNYLLGGGGFGSRLMEEIRVQRGLAYSVGSFFDTKKFQGSFQVVLQTKNASAREAMALVMDQMERIRKEPVSDEALRRAKSYLIGSFPRRFNTQGKLVNFLSQVEYFGLGLDYPEKYPVLIQSVSREDVLRVARKYLHPEQAIQVIVGNLKEAGLAAPDQ
ncbi:MAG: insulinase family protein [Deltaproteobacteria bacterium]|nr:insulinase family protein [Deltaproteobacteria bacterium]